VVTRLLGRPATALAILAACLGASSIDGASYTPAQAASGAAVYAANCAQCHGQNLEGGAGPPLSGENLKTLSKSTKLTVGDLFTFMSQQMPMNAPASLRPDQYAAIMAYILKRNGYPPGSAPLRYASALGSKTALTSRN